MHGAWIRYHKVRTSDGIGTLRAAKCYTERERERERIIHAGNVVMAVCRKIKPR